MNDWLPHTECDPVLVDVKAGPPGGLRPALTPTPGAATQATSGTPALRGGIRITNLESPRFQGIATCPNCGSLTWWPLGSDASWRHH
jgi:hypothetical protein